MTRPWPAAALLLCSWAGAQGRTFVVDASNGTGTHFTDLPAALAQAQDGDVFLVRAGSYTSVTTGKGVSLLGSPGATVAWTNAVPFLTVTGLVAGASFCMRGFSLLLPSGSAPKITIWSGNSVGVRLATLAAGPAQLGGVVQSTLLSTPLDPLFWIAGLPAGPAAYPSTTGLLFVDPAAFLVLATGMQAANGQSTLAVPLPNDAALRGRALCFQAATYSVSLGVIQLTNPAVAVLY